MKKKSISIFQTYTIVYFQSHQEENEKKKKRKIKDPEGIFN